MSSQRPRDGEQCFDLVVDFIAPGLGNLSKVHWLIKSTFVHSVTKTATTKARPGALSKLYFPSPSEADLGSWALCSFMSIESTNQKSS